MVVVESSLILVVDVFLFATISEVLPHAVSRARCNQTDIDAYDGCGPALEFLLKNYNDTPSIRKSEPPHEAIAQHPRPTVRQKKAPSCDSKSTGCEYKREERN